MHRRHTMTAASIVGLLALIALAVAAWGTLRSVGAETPAIEAPGLAKVMEAEPVDAGPQRFDTSLVVHSVEMNVQVPGENGPIPSAHYAQATVLAKGTDVPYVTIGNQCAAAMLKAGSPQVDGGLCMVFHSQTAYDEQNLIASQLVDEGELQAGSTNLMGNLCYTVIAWALADGTTGAIDQRSDGPGWEGYECPTLPTGSAP